jgi:hypothetical protein
MRYICHKRFKGKCLSGEVNIPAGSRCIEIRGMIVWNNLAICYNTSEHAYTYFCRDDDGNGMERGSLIRAIKGKLAKNDSQHQARWDKIWDDPICQNMKSKQIGDFWVWGFEFYNASIEDLKHIAGLIGAKEGTV